MRRTVVVCVLGLLAATAALGQWSEPQVVSQSGVWNCRSQLVCVPGDTLWTFLVRGRGDQMARIDTSFVTAYWNADGHWQGPDTVTVANEGASGPGAGIDPSGRIWLAWYSGPYPWNAGQGGQSDDPWGTYTTVRDSGRWSTPQLAISSQVTGLYPTAHCFAADEQGRWYLGFRALGYDSLPFTSAAYSTLRGDTWAALRFIGQGRSGEPPVYHGLPLLVRRPDYGVWAVHRVNQGSVPDTIHVDVIAGDSLARLLSFEGAGLLATADSSGRLWVVFNRDSALRSVTIEGGAIVDERVISTNISFRSGPAAVCTDPMGWVWAAWTTRDTMPVVSYNWGARWAEAEAVTDSTGWAEGLVSESDGRMHALFRTRSHYSVYRLERPGIEEQVTPETFRLNQTATVVRNVLLVSHSVFDTCHSEFALRDITGRKVAELHPGANDVRHLAPGVYFVRNETTAKSAKVVVQR